MLNIKKDWRYLDQAQKIGIVRNYIDKIVITDGIMEIYWLSIAQPTVLNIEDEKSNIFVSYWMGFQNKRSE